MTSVRRRSASKKILLFFAAYLLFSILLVAFDQHGPVPGKTCLICSMGGFLFSVLGQSGFTPEIQPAARCAYIIEDAHNTGFLAATTGISYRGPPPPALSF